MPNFRRGTIISSTGATIGRVGVAVNKMATNQSICGIIPKKYEVMVSLSSSYI